MRPTAHPLTRSLAVASAAIALVLTVAACGSSAPATTAPSQAVAPSVAASVAPPSVAASPAPSTPVASGGTAVDPTEGLKIGAPYSLTVLPEAMATLFEQQMAAGLASFGDTIKVGFRQIDGGTGTNILMVMKFPDGSLNAAAYQAALAGMGSSLAGATFTTTTVDGVDISSAKAATGGMGVFHNGDLMMVVIASTEADVVPIATALVQAN
jgi:hypothetical protein